MIIDMHMHEMRYSGDSFLRLENMVEIAKRRGLDGICITDHDSMGLKEFAAEYSEKTGFPIFVGIEFYSLQGDIVAFGIEDYPKERIPAQEFVDLVQAQGGMCFSAHPFRNNNRGLEENLKIVKGLDGIEVLNGSTLYEANRKAAEYAAELGLATVGSREIRSVQELIRSVKRCETLPVYYKEGGYYLWDMKNPIDAPFHIYEQEQMVCAG